MLAAFTLTKIGMSIEISKLAKLDDFQGVDEPGGCSIIRANLEALRAKKLLAPTLGQIVGRAAARAAKVQGAALV